MTTRYLSGAPLGLLLAAGCFYNPSGSAAVSVAETTGGASSEEGVTGTTMESAATTMAAPTSSTAADGTTETTGDEPTDTTGEGLPDAAVLKLSFSQIKQFDFTWTAVGADYYQLHERSDPGQDYLQVGADIEGDVVSTSLTVPLHFRASASYVLKACNTIGCTDSEAVSVTGSLAEAVGYFKASNTGKGDLFGSQISLSADGNTLAVGASEEDSATNLDGDQSDDSAYGAGAVYVFHRTGSVWSQQAYIKASNTGAIDHFGGALALSADGNTLVVGAFNEDSGATGVGGDQNSNTSPGAGAVYVFKRAGAAWSQQEYIKASNTGDGDLFGERVALSGDGGTLAVGASNEASAAEGIDGDQLDDSAGYSGAVYVFKWDGETWAQQAYVKASNTGEYDNFGFGIALSADGNTMAVGAPGERSGAKGVSGEQDDDSAPNAGAAYVFKRSGVAWTQQAYIKASNAEQGDQFGEMVALSADGDTLVVTTIKESSGATGVGGDQTSESAPGSGAAYVFRRAVGLWSQQAYIKPSNTTEGQEFGSSVALSGDGSVLAIGSIRDASAAEGVGGGQADKSAAYSGAVYVFGRADGWAQRAYVKASNTEKGDRFGRSVAISGDGQTLSVGAENEGCNSVGIGGDQRDDSAPMAGAVYLY